MKLLIRLSAIVALAVAGYFIYNQHSNPTEAAPGRAVAQPQQSVGATASGAAAVQSSSSSSPAAMLGASTPQ